MGRTGSCESVRPPPSSPSHLDGGETGETGAIDGTGRLELYGAYLFSAYDNRFYFRRPEVYLDRSAVDGSKTPDPYALDPRPDFISPEVQLWRSWREGVSSPLNPMGASWGTNKASFSVTFLDPSRAEQFSSTALLAVLYDKATGQLLRIVPGALQSGMVFRFDCELGQGWNLIAADSGGSFAPLCGKMDLLDRQLIRETASR